MFGKIRSQLITQGPSFLKFPLKVTPFVVQRQILEQLLSWQFRESVKEGELDFLEGKWLKVEIRDLELVWFISLQEGQLVVQKQAEPDVSVSGNANDLVLIAARKEDPDTLFFQRRLVIEGDTELGLYVKNLMDAFEIENMPAPLRFGLLQLADVIKTVQDSEDAEHKTPVLTSC
ncbi:SCP2 domain-containing protein [Providencia sp. PROV188]|uniref:ubiquinone anaerobic biosynthesis accessory factor UbiT n=1 Tax=Providencia TaxID=586 RepID=UPI0003E1BF1D|nr:MULTISPECIES: SCP2 domain-containing protein [Providencia]MBS0923881.1 SCP2 domain-containing protein [Providencia sp. JGM181]MBS0933864.1 SCP2 domain-containing protein [Providencia sp. JGM172]MBS0998569.1 SCP2 domain-containing protein [Providencia sp. JGM178]MTB47111.1 SCP2 domain-containing protein [Providencia sp. wls1950]MTC22677.1 SCP2 domain-containing protein [Providencia sp. wls1938]MTC44871.1 SCP2 domain-containing protein [Providencia sp. wls1922]MTC76786.1 SCP2 domain-contain